MEEYDAELHKATLVGKSLSGQIYNDKKGRFANGTWVTTSSVLEQVEDIVKTRNSTYKLIK